MRRALPVAALLLAILALFLFAPEAKAASSPIGDAINTDSLGQTGVTGQPGATGPNQAAPIAVPPGLGTQLIVYPMVNGQVDRTRQVTAFTSVSVSGAGAMAEQVNGKWVVRGGAIDDVVTFTAVGTDGKTYSGTIVVYDPSSDDGDNASAGTTKTVVLPAVLIRPSTKEPIQKTGLRSGTTVTWIGPVQFGSVDSNGDFTAGPDQGLNYLYGFTVPTLTDPLTLVIAPIIIAKGSFGDSPTGGTDFTPIYTNGRSVAKGEVVQLSSFMSIPADVAKYTWAVSDPNFATVDAAQTTLTIGNVAPTNPLYLVATSVATPKQAFYCEIIITP